MSTHYGSKREGELELFRGVNLCTNNEYTIGEWYRFITFQSCSTNMNKAASYMNGVEKAFYKQTIITIYIFLNIYRFYEK